MAVIIKRIGIESAEVLLQISSEVFYTAFALLNHPDDMAAYSAKAFTIERISDELNNSDSFFYFAYIQGEIAGYLKLNYNSAQSEFKGKEAMEVERIYVTQAFQNKQIGQQLLQFAIDAAITQKLKYVWLGVW